MSRMKEIIKKSLGLSLLYVEDNKDARESTLMVLESFFKDIDVAINGEDALQMYANKKYDLIITDISMPKIDGTQVIQEVRDKDKNIPIFIFSAHNKAKYLNSVGNIDINYYLSKPLSLEQLLEALNKVI